MYSEMASAAEVLEEIIDGFARLGLTSPSETQAAEQGHRLGKLRHLIGCGDPADGSLAGGFDAGVCRRVLEHETLSPEAASLLLEGEEGLLKQSVETLVGCIAGVAGGRGGSAGDGAEDAYCEDSQAWEALSALVQCVCRPPDEQDQKSPKDALATIQRQVVATLMRATAVGATASVHNEGVLSRGAAMAGATLSWSPSKSPRAPTGTRHSFQQACLHALRDPTDMDAVKGCLCCLSLLTMMARPLSASTIEATEEVRKLAAGDADKDLDCVSGVVRALAGAMQGTEDEESRVEVMEHALRLLSNLLLEPDLQEGRSDGVDAAMGATSLGALNRAIRIVQVRGGVDRAVDCVMESLRRPESKGVVVHGFRLMGRLGRWLGKERVFDEVGRGAFTEKVFGALEKGMCDSSTYSARLEACKAMVRIMQRPRDEAEKQGADLHVEGALMRAGCYIRLLGCITTGADASGRLPKMLRHAAAYATNAVVIHADECEECRRQLDNDIENASKFEGLGPALLEVMGWSRRVAPRKEAVWGGSTLQGICCELSVRLSRKWGSTEESRQWDSSVVTEADLSKAVKKMIRIQGEREGDLLQRRRGGRYEKRASMLGMMWECFEHFGTSAAAVQHVAQAAVSAVGDIAGRCRSSRAQVYTQGDGWSDKGSLLVALAILLNNKSLLKGGAGSPLRTRRGSCWTEVHESEITAVVDGRCEDLESEGQGNGRVCEDEVIAVIDGQRERLIGDLVWCWGLLGCEVAAEDAHGDEEEGSTGKAERMVADGCCTLLSHMLERARMEEEGVGDPVQVEDDPDKSSLPFDLAPERPPYNREWRAVQQVIDTTSDCFPDAAPSACCLTVMEMLTGPAGARRDATCSLCELDCTHAQGRESSMLFAAATLRRLSEEQEVSSFLYSLLRRSCAPWPPLASSAAPPPPLPLAPGSADDILIRAKAALCSPPSGTPGGSELDHGQRAVLFRLVSFAMEESLRASAESVARLQRPVSPHLSEASLRGGGRLQGQQQRHEVRVGRDLVVSAKLRDCFGTDILEPRHVSELIGSLGFVVSRTCNVCRDSPCRCLSAEQGLNSAFSPRCNPVWREQGGDAVARLKAEEAGIYWISVAFTQGERVCLLGGDERRLQVVVRPVFVLEHREGRILCGCSQVAEWGPRVLGIVRGVNVEGPDCLRLHRPGPYEGRAYERELAHLEVSLRSLSSETSVLELCDVDKAAEEARGDYALFVRSGEDWVPAVLVLEDGKRLDDTILRIRRSDDPRVWTHEDVEEFVQEFIAEHDTDASERLMFDSGFDLVDGEMLCADIAQYQLAPWLGLDSRDAVLLQCLKRELDDMVHMVEEWERMQECDDDWNPIILSHEIRPAIKDLEFHGQDRESHVQEAWLLQEGDDEACEVSVEVLTDGDADAAERVEEVVRGLHDASMHCGHLVELYGMVISRDREGKRLLGVVHERCSVPLSRILKQHTLPLSSKVRIALGVALGVKVINKEGFVHGGIKDENVSVFGDHAVLCGIARNARKRDADALVDVHGLGRLLDIIFQVEKDECWPDGENEKERSKIRKVLDDLRGTGILKKGEVGADLVLEKTVGELTDISEGLLRRERLQVTDFPALWRDLDARDELGGLEKMCNRKPLAELPPDSEVYEAVRRHFVDTLKRPDGGAVKFQTFKVEVNRKVLMYRMHKLREQMLAKENGWEEGKGDPRGAEYSNVQYLWHGTDLDTAEAIMNGGFEKSRCRLTSCRYGAGVYFAPDLRLSHHFANVPPRRQQEPHGSHCGQRNVILARVAVGKMGEKASLTKYMRLHECVIHVLSQKFADSEIGKLLKEMQHSQIIKDCPEAQKHLKSLRAMAQFLGGGPEDDKQAFQRLPLADKESIMLELGRALLERSDAPAADANNKLKADIAQRAACSNGIVLHPSGRILFADTCKDDLKKHLVDCVQRIKWKNYVHLLTANDTHRVPPSGCHSVTGVDDVPGIERRREDGTELIIFDNEQAFPAFKVTYEFVEGSAAAPCDPYKMPRYLGDGDNEDKPFLKKVTDEPTFAIGNVFF